MYMYMYITHDKTNIIIMLTLVPRSLYMGPMARAGSSWGQTYEGCLKTPDDAGGSGCLSAACADPALDHASALTDGKTGEPENMFYPATVLALEISTPHSYSFPRGKSVAMRVNL